MQNWKSFRAPELLVAGLLAAMAGALPGWSQVTTADVLGTVTDSSGAVLVGAAVTVSNLATGATRSVVADDHGDYLISALAIGHYRLKAESKGFKVYEIPDLALAKSDRR